MSKARKCDRCGKFYEPYFCDDQSRFALDVNGIAFAKIFSDGEPRVLNNDSYDLCQKCLDDMHEFLKIPKLREHARWDEMQCFHEHGLEMAQYQCTNCGWIIKKQRGFAPDYCELCGARMDAGEDQSGGGGENATD